MERWLYGWALGYASVGAASLLIPLYALSLGGGALLVGVLASTAALAGVPGAILWGRLAARTERRRPFVLVALALTALVLAVTPAIDAAWSLVVANSALWFVVSAAAPVLNLIVVANVPESAWESHIGRLNAYQGYGWVAGLVVGTVWTALASAVFGPVRAQELLFLLLAAIAAAGFAVVRLRYPEPADISTERFRRVYRRLGIAPTTGRLMRAVPIGPGRIYWALTDIRQEGIANLRTPLWAYLGAVGVFSVGFAVFWAPAPAYLTAVGFADTAVFVLFLAANVGSAVCYDRVGSLSARFGSGRTQLGALLARAAFFPAVAAVGGLVGGYALAALFVAIGITWAVIAVTATGTVARVVPASRRAEAFGLYTAAVGVGTSMGSVLGGALAVRTTYAFTFAAAGVIVLVGAVLVVVSLSSRDQEYKKLFSI